jgi:hypothetical protein
VATPIPQDDSDYWRFYDDVAAAQLAQWLPERPCRVLDVSGGGHFAGQLTAAGHDVLSLDHPPVDPAAGAQAELVVEQLTRVLRPGGRMLLVVESLMLGLARLAEQGRWAELADAPSADVVLVADDDGNIKRCFWPEELRSLLTGCGLEVEWVRPRSVLSVATVERAVQQGGDVALRTLVQTELALAVEREGESTGLYLFASARRPD